MDETLTPEKFVELASRPDELLVRSLVDMNVHYGHRPPSVRIEIWAFSKQLRSLGSEPFLGGLAYEATHTDFYRFGNDLKTVEHSQNGDDQGLKRAGGILKRWEVEAPLWLQPKSAVACFSDAPLEVWQTIPVTSWIVLAHLMRFEGRLKSRAERRDKFASYFDERLCGLINSLFKQRTAVVGFS